MPNVLLTRQLLGEITADHLSTVLTLTREQRIAAFRIGFEAGSLFGLLDANDPQARLTDEQRKAVEDAREQ